MTRAIAVFQRRGANLKIIKVECDRKFFQVKVNAIVEKKRYEIGVTIHPDAPAGPFAKTIKVYTNNSEQPLLQSIVLGSIVPQVKVSPAAFYLEAKMDPQGFSRELKITGPVSPPLKIKIKAITNPGFKATLKATSDGGYRLKLTMNSQVKKGVVKGKIILETNQLGEKILEIPLGGTLTE